MRLDAARLDALVWTLVFGGLLVLGLGISLQRQGAGYGWAVVVAGAILVGAGAFFVWVRSRVPDSEP
ncbi:MAG: hypothetical protein JO090_05930 [Rhizobacter sp.]|nr:hypothetical protein [Rhizobacter sp.]